MCRAKTMQALVLGLVFSLVVISASPIISEKEEITNAITPIEEKQLSNLENFTSKKSVGIHDAKSFQFRTMRSSTQVEARKKPKKFLKKAFLPIVIFLVIKAIILIPLALGLLAFKTWNAIQLSFVSFVSAIGIAFWKLSSKLNSDDHHPIKYSGWDLDRNDPQLQAYNGYVPYYQ